ncbi:MAG TPA: hypothetical protein VMU27_01280 [Candidatus Paceibacterota bacterium]|nr:hypothetical protein [Candidatus Paceibacterota bacterium]
MTFTQVVHLILVYRYLIIVPLSFIEGPIVAFIAGALALLGYFNPYGMFAFLIARDVIVDNTMYSIGRFGGQTRFAQAVLKKIRFTDNYLADVRKLWDEHPLRTMFFSKLSYGLSASFLIVAGIVEMPFSIFFRYGVIVALLQYGLLFVLGYFVGNSFTSFGNALNNILFALGIISLFIIIYYIFAHMMSSKLIAQERAADEEITHHN